MDSTGFGGYFWYLVSGKGKYFCFVEIHHVLVSSVLKCAHQYTSIFLLTVSYAVLISVVFPRMLPCYVTG